MQLLPALVFICGGFMLSIFSSARPGVALPGRKRRAVIVALLALSSGYAAAGPGALPFEEALRLAAAASASAKASRASVEASTEAAARADQLPDPMLKAGIDNLPVTGPDKFSPTADFMTMRRIGIEQLWVSRDKRRARADRAQRAMEANEGAYLEKVASVREEAGKAWLNMMYKQRALVLSRRIAHEMEQDLGGIQAAHRGAKVSASDVLQSKMELIQGGDEVRAAEQELKTARIGLRRWTKVDVATVADAPPEFAAHLPSVPLTELENYHPMVLNARRSVSLADAETTVAVKERNPDWSFEAGFAQRGSQYSNMVSFGISIPLAINRAQRQDRDVAEKSALGTKARLEYEDALIDMQSQIQTLSARLESMKSRIASLKGELLPAATEQVDLAVAAYSSGGGTLTSVFKAKRIALEKQLMVNELEKDAALVWATLELHVIPHDMAAEARAAK
jgi:outer membrane protein TolC